MRLLQREPETPSLETWLSRNVPHERELTGELLDRMGRETALAALLVIHDREEAKREKWQVGISRVAVGLLCVFVANLILGWPGFRLIPLAFTQILQLALMALSALLQFIRLLSPIFRVSQRQKSIVTALFDYDDSPLIADPLCRALAYYGDPLNGRWHLLEHLQRVLPLLPDDKAALTKDARAALRDCLIVLESAGTPNITREQQRDRTRYAAFELVVLRYFTRTRDKNALPAIRKIAKANTYSDDGVRVREAARDALQAFGQRSA